MNLLLDRAKELRNIIIEATPEQHAHLASCTLHNIARYFKHGYAVRMRIAGQQQNIGLTHDLMTAARFADMSHLYLVQIGARSFRKNDFNFDRATAEADLKHPTAAPLLGEIVQCLFPNGVPAKPEKAKRKSLRGDLEALQVRVDELQRELTQVHGNLCSVQDKLSVL